MSHERATTLLSTSYFEGWDIPILRSSISMVLVLVRASVSRGILTCRHPGSSRSRSVVTGQVKSLSRAACSCCLQSPTHQCLGWALIAMSICLKICEPNRTNGMEGEHGPCQSSHAWALPLWGLSDCVRLSLVVTAVLSVKTSLDPVDPFGLV